MNEIDKINLSEQTKFWLSKIIRIENYFHQEINQRKLYTKKLSKYVTACNYIDKILIVLSATSSGVCIISSASVVGAPVGITSRSFTLIISLTTGIIKKLLSITRNKKKKYGKILVLTKSKLDSIETLIFQALIDMEISQWRIWCNYWDGRGGFNADSRAIQQIEFHWMLKTNSQVCTVLEKSKETMLEFYKGTAKVLWII